MEKLILERDENDYYKLEINDNGDYIEFDLTDIGLAERVMKASEEIDKISKDYTEKEIKINEEIKDETEKAKQFIKLESEKDKELRKQFDSFLGEGACQKIFGNKKKYGQYALLMDALQPHFSKMQIQMKKAKNKLAQKYLPKKNDVM